MNNKECIKRDTEKYQNRQIELSIEIERTK